MKKNDVVSLTIEDLGADGMGVGKADGMAFFVKDALPGDKVSARVLKVKKSYVYARLMELLEPSPDRVEPLCPLHRCCGGCQIQALDYQKQLEYKERKVKNSLMRIGGFAEDEIPMRPIIGMESPYRYRNKAQFPIGRDKDGNLTAGFYASRTHSIIPVSDCYLGPELNRDVMERTLGWMRRFDIEPYDEKTGRGLVRHVLIRYGFYSHQLMVCLVINGGFLPHAEELTVSLREIPQLRSLSFCINRQRNNVIMGDEVKTVWGTDYIEDTIGAVKFQISPLSFYQVNPVQTEKLYNLALEFADLHGTETVWDLYCGIGTISLFLARKAKRVYGVEIVPQAVSDARNNARINGITNVEFFEGSAEDVLPRFCGQAGFGDREAGDGGTDRVYGNPQVIVVDPPRKGCAESLLETIVRARPERIVYVSCDPATLARDLKFLCGRGYAMRAVQAVDQFGMTVHVETVCLLSNRKRKPDSYVKLSLNMEDYYRIMDAEKVGK